MKLKLADDLSLPVDAVTQTFLIVGKRGSGKSNTAARLVEQLHAAKIPFVVLDPVDTWYGLKASGDGGPGLDVYVFGGAHADLPLEPHGGALLAEVLCDHRIPMVLSVKHLSGRERSAFMVAFAQTLFQKWTGGPLHVVLEEAHEFAPQMSGGRGGSQDNEAAMLGAFKRLWKLGRASGIGGSAITQRPASLSKDITTQSEILIAHRTIGPQDVAAIGQWVKYHGEREDLLAELPSLPTGEAFVWAPEFPEGHPIGLKRVTILRRETFDSASTPKVGERRIQPKELAPVDLERLRTKMSATIERAKADDPRELRRQIAQLKAELGKKEPAVEVKHQAPKVVEKFVLKDGQLGRAEAIISHLEQLAEKASDYENDLRVTAKEIRDAIASTRNTQANSQQRVMAPTGAPTIQSSRLDAPQGRRVTPAPVTSRPASLVSSNGDLGGPERKILTALAELRALNLYPADKQQLGLMAGYTNVRSGGFSEPMGRLIAGGYAVSPSPGVVEITAAGLSHVGEVTPPASPEEMQARTMAKLSGPERRILSVLLDAYPEDLTKADLAARCDPPYTNIRSGGFSEPLGRLTTLGLVRSPRPGVVVASPALFLEDR